MTRRVAASTVAMVVLGAYAGAVCRDWAASGRYARHRGCRCGLRGCRGAKSTSDFASDCAPDRVVFSVSSRLEGGEQAVRGYILPSQTTLPSAQAPSSTATVVGLAAARWLDRASIRSRWAVATSSSRWGEPGKLESMGCGASQAPHSGRLASVSTPWAGGDGCAKVTRRPNKELKLTKHGQLRSFAA